MPDDATSETFPDQDPGDKSFGAAAAEKEEKADQAVAEDGDVPEDAEADEKSGPPAAGKASEGTPPAT